MKKIILVLALIGSLFAWDEAVVKTVIDGDTLMLQKGNEEPFKVRLIAIDTFETKVNDRLFMQLETLKMLYTFKHEKEAVEKVLELGEKAKKYVSDRYLGKTVKYHFYLKDKYDRDLIWVDVLNFSLVREGLALYYPNNQIDKDRKAYILDLSREANLERRGIYKRIKDGSE